MYFLMDMKRLLDSGTAHSLVAVYFNMFANVGLCALNAFWLFGMVKKKLRKQHVE